MTDNIIFNLSKKSNGECPYPKQLVVESLDQVDSSIWSNPNSKVYNPCCGSGTFIIDAYNRFMKGLEYIIPNEESRKKHILQNCLYATDIKYKFIAHTINILDFERKYINLEHFLCEDALTYDWFVDFDVVMACPSHTVVSGTGNSVWRIHYKSYLKMVKTNGYLIINLPPKWRSPHVLDKGKRKLVKSTIFKDLKHTQIVFIRMINESSGYNHVRSDSIVVKKSKRNTTTKIVDINNKEYNISLDGYEWLPNSMIDEIKTFIANDPNNLIDIRHKFEAEPRGADIKKQKEKTDTHQYPCINSIKQDGSLVLFYSKNPNLTMLSLPKVVLSHSGNCYAYNDYEKQYGVTHHGYSVIVKTNEEAEKICNFVKSDYFKKLSEACRWSTKQAGIVDALYFFDKKIYESY